MIKREPYDVEKYIQDTIHFINYCEAIMDTKGNIANAVPSHEKYLEWILERNGETDLAEKIPLTANPVLWMVEHSGYIGIWTNFAIADEISDVQIHSLKRLQESGRISMDFLIQIKKEKSVCAAKTPEDIYKAAGKRKTFLLRQGIISELDVRKNMRFHRKSLYGESDILN